MRRRRPAGPGGVPRRQVLAAGLGLAAGLAARVRPARPAPPAPTLAVGLPAGVDVLDPHQAVTVGSMALAFHLYDGLLTRLADGTLRPALATAWRRLAPTAWRFDLRPGVTFADGTPLTADDVRASLDRARDPRGPTRFATAFGTIARVEAPDPGAVVVHTTHPDPLLLARLAHYGGQVLSARAARAPAPEGPGGRPAGTGPVRLVEWVPGDRTVVERRDDYWGGPLDPARIVFRTIPEVATRVAALLKGEIDLAGDVPPDQVERLARQPGIRWERSLYAGLYVLAVDARRPPLGDPRVRQALSLAIDREALARDLWRGHALVPSGPIPQGEAHHDPALPPLRFDPDLARRRLREAGYAGQPVVLESGAGRDIADKAMGEVVVGLWRDVGVNARLELLEWSVIAQKIREKSFKGLRWGQPTSPYGDPDGLLWRLLAPGGTYDTWRHPRFVELGRLAQASLDEGVRGRAYREMTALFLEHLPMIPVLQPVISYGVRAGVEWRAYPTRRYEFRRFNLRLPPP